MSKPLIQILYNPSSLSSLEPALETVADCGEDASEQALAAIAGLTRLDRAEVSAKAAHQGLIRVKRLLALPLPTLYRLNLIENANRMLEHFGNRFTNDIDVFQACVQIVTLFKEDIESRPAAHADTVRREWVELEKSIYHLSVWEGQLDYFWSEAH